MKEVNLNAFSEKLLHRYLLEVFYGISSDRRIRSDLLPPWARKKKINLVVPESGREGVRPDLELFFSDAKKLPIEVKWKSSELRKENQITYLRKNKGHLISLVGDGKSHEGITSSVIDYDHFTHWLGGNSIVLAGDSAANFGLTQGRQYWLCSPKGFEDTSTIQNYNRMRGVKKSRKGHFWAFKNHPENIRNHLRIRKGDRVIFAIVNTRKLGKEKGHWLKIEPDWPLNVLKWAEYEVSTPYSIDLNDDLSVFFEDGDPSPGERTWPHFINFNLICEGGSCKLEKRGELAMQFKNSSSPIRGGGPELISAQQYESLLSKLMIGS